MKTGTKRRNCWNRFTKPANTMLNGERYKRIKRNLEQQPTSNDKYDGIKKSIMTLSVSLNLTFSALFCITCFFFLFASHFFIFNQMACCYLSCGVGCGICCLCYVSRNFFFHFNRCFFSNPRVKWVYTTNILISSEWNSRYYTGIKFGFIIPQVWCLNWNHIALRTSLLRYYQAIFFNQDSLK